MPAKKVSAAARRHADFMIHTLAPDLKASGREFTARDVRRCGRLMMAGKRNRPYASWLKSTLIPDLRESGMEYTANDLARCARAISTAPKRKRKRKAR
jgi:hypothetical protein